MFVLKNWLIENILSGYENGQFSREYISLKSTDYLLKGVLTESDVALIAEATKAPEGPVEEIIEEGVNENA